MCVRFLDDGVEGERQDRRQMHMAFGHIQKEKNIRNILRHSVPSTGDASVE